MISKSHYLFTFFVVAILLSCSKTPVPLSSEELNLETYTSYGLKSLRQDSSGTWWALSATDLYRILPDTAAEFRVSRISGSPEAAYMSFVKVGGNLYIYDDYNDQIRSLGTSTLSTTPLAFGSVDIPAAGGLWVASSFGTGLAAYRIECFDGDGMVEKIVDTVRLSDSATMVLYKRMLAVSVSGIDTLVSIATMHNAHATKIALYRNNNKLTELDEDSLAAHYWNGYRYPDDEFRGTDVKDFWWQGRYLHLFVRFLYANDQTPAGYSNYFDRLLVYSSVDSAFIDADVNGYWEFGSWLGAQKSVRRESLSDSFTCFFGDSSYLTVTTIPPVQYRYSAYSLFETVHAYPYRNTSPNLFNIPGIDSAGRLVLYNEPTREFYVPLATF